jgi:hypothetical protein
VGIRAVIAGGVLLAGCASIPPLDGARFISIERVAAMPSILWGAPPPPRTQELPLLRVVFSAAEPLMRAESGNFSAMGRIGFCSGAPMAQVEFLWRGEVVTRDNLDEIARSAEDAPPRYEAFFRYRPLPMSADSGVPIEVPPPQEDLCLGLMDWVGWPAQSPDGAPLQIPREAVAAALVQPLP